MMDCFEVMLRPLNALVTTHLKIYLYDIPRFTGVNISLELIERLIARYPSVIFGIKDSSGNWENTQSILERKWDDFRVFVGSETFLLQTMRAGRLLDVFLQL